MTLYGNPQLSDQDVTRKAIFPVLFHNSIIQNQGYPGKLCGQL